MEISSKVIKSNLCFIYTQMIVLSLFEIFLWWAFSNLYFSVATIENAKEKKLINFFAKTLVILMWLWTSGALIAFADYFTCSYTV